MLSAPSVTSFYPPADSHTAAVETDVSVTYDQEINLASVGPQSFAVHGMQTGQLTDSDAAMDVRGNVISVQAARQFFSGESVQVTATKGIVSVQGEAARAPFVWQFRVSTASGTAFFGKGGPELGDTAPQALGLGDLDGDGDLDAFMANDGASTVWLNDGDGGLHDTGQRLGSADSRAVALGDLDGDGDLDVFVGNRAANTVWLNDGQGTFQDSGQSLGSSVTQAVALGDLDGDGDLDAFAGNLTANRVWLNDGRAAFQESGQTMGRSRTQSVALGDLDGDGDLDALVGNDGPNEVWLAANDFPGYFRNSWQALDSARTHSVALGDLDGDGDLDAFIGNAGNDEVWRNVDDAPGYLEDTGQRLGNWTTQALALGDLDGDGDLDVFAVSDQGNHVWLNTNPVPGHFQAGLQTMPRFEASEVVLGDLDGDGKLDALVVGDGGSTVWIQADAKADLSIVLTNDQTVARPGQEVVYSIRATNEGPEGVENATVTTAFPPQIVDATWSCAASEGARCTQEGEGDLQDSVVLPAGGSVVYTARGIVAADAAGNLTTIASVTPPGGPHDIDLTNDLAIDTDVLLPVDVAPPVNSHTASPETAVSVTYNRLIDPATVTPQTFVVQRMQQGQLHEPARVDGSTISLIPTEPLIAGEQVQVTATGGLDHTDSRGAISPLVWQFRTATTGGAGLFGDSGQRLGDSWTDAVALGDVDGDGDLDAFVGNKVWLNDGQGSFRDNGQSLGDSFYGAVALGDVDGDGDLDAFVGHRGRSNQVWLNDGRGTFRDNGQRVGDLFTDAAVALGDVDGDGDLDAFVRSASNGRQDHKVWLNDGQGNFRDNGQSLGGPDSRTVALGDVDGDGDLDAFVGNEVWLNDGQGSFRDNGQRLGDSNGRAVVLGDVDGDGDLDAFVGKHEGNEVWLNDGVGNFRGNGQSLGHSSSVAVALGDVDGDGDLDAFVGNEGEPDRVWLNADISADLSITTTNGQLVASPGQSMTYTVTVTSRGRESVSEATVTDIFPAQVTDVIWSCTASAGSRCTPTGFGDINDTVSLSAGGTVTYTATGELAGGATGRITNVATVVGPGGLHDIERTNNTARDVDTVPPLRVIPEFNSHAQPVVDLISATYPHGISAATASPQSFAVHGMQTGLLLEPANTINVSGDTISVTPAQPFHAGELVRVSATRGIENLQSEAAEPFVWEFRAGTSGGTGFFGESVQPIGNSPILAMALGDLDGDGDLDVLATYWDESKVWLNDGNGDFSDSGQDLRDLRPDSPSEVSLGDVDGDGDLDAFVANRADDAEPNSVWLNDGQGNYRDSGQMLGDSASYAAALGDLDGDGDLDVFVGNAGGPNKVWLNDGQGTFNDSGQRMGDSNSNAVALGDLDGDGDLDAFVGNGQPNTVWLNRDTPPQAAPGDANRDWQFDQSDVAQVLQALKYLTGEPADWTEGDFNGDAVFDQLDIVEALQTGNYFQGPYAAYSSVRNSSIGFAVM